MHFLGFCGDSCFTTSRRARYKSQKFGIEIARSRPKPVSKSPVSPPSGHSTSRSKYSERPRPPKRQKILKPQNPKNVEKYRKSKVENIISDTEDDIPLSFLGLKKEKRDVECQTNFLQNPPAQNLLGNMLIVPIPIIIPIPIPPLKKINPEIKTDTDEKPLDLSTK